MGNKQDFIRALSSFYKQRNILAACSRRSHCEVGSIKKGALAVDRNSFFMRRFSFPTHNVKIADDTLEA